MASFSVFVFSLIFVVPLGALWAASWPPQASKSMVLPKEIDGFQNVTFSVLGSFLAPFWSPGGSLGEFF